MHACVHTSMYCLYYSSVCAGIVLYCTMYYDVLAPIYVISLIVTIVFVEHIDTRYLCCGWTLFLVLCLRSVQSLMENIVSVLPSFWLTCNLGEAHMLCHWLRMFDLLGFCHALSLIAYVWSVRILSCFQEEMMVQENSIELEKKMAWSRRSKSRWSSFLFSDCKFFLFW